MAQCIFCKDTSACFGTREHILPESLGGGDWSILPGGLFCDSCQNRFGSEVEQQALGDYPFSFFRVFFGIPTKKGKAPWFKSWEGVISASSRPGMLGYDPAPMFEGATVDRSKTQIRLLAHPMKPNMVCRFLLKMGIEIVAADSASDVFDEKFDIARHFALTGKKPCSWWYLQSERMDGATRFLNEGVSHQDWLQSVNLEVIRLDEGHEIFHLRLLYLDIFAPLTFGIQPEMEGLEEPVFRLFNV